MLPVGGVLLGESFIEPLSRRMVRVGGASVRAGQLVPHAGGYQALLDNKVEWRIYMHISSHLEDRPQKMICSLVCSLHIHVTSEIQTFRYKLS